MHNRHQEVLLNGKSSTWASVLAGVPTLPQGSILGPLFFLLIYIKQFIKGYFINSQTFW